MEALQVTRMSDQDSRISGSSMRPNDGSRQTRTISVIIATKDRAGSLSSVLSDLAKQTTNDSFTYEVIVADNGSVDQTRQVIEQMAPSYPVPLRYIHEEKPGKANALNHAMMEASGEVLAFTDDDVAIQASWLSIIHHP